MLPALAALWLCLHACLPVLGRKVQHCGRYTLSSLGGSGIHERTFQRRWRLLTSPNSDLSSNLRRELVKIAAQLPGAQGLPPSDPLFLLAEADRVRHLIVPDRLEVFLSKYWEVERLEQRGLFGDAFAWLFGSEEYVTYSAWQYRPNIISKGGNITLELHYKIPIAVAGQSTFFFEPIVVYTCDVSPGKYISGTATFSIGSVEVLTHPFWPWRRVPAGSVRITPAHLPTTFSS